MHYRPIGDRKPKETDQHRLSADGLLKGCVIANEIIQGRLVLTCRHCDWNPPTCARHQSQSRTRLSGSIRMLFP
jgi:hypothetical protein